MSLLFPLALIQVAASAELVTNWVTVADGLPTNWTSAIAEDDDGLIWIGGPGWMVRYDGERMRSWSVPRPMGMKVVDIVPLAGGPVAFRLHDEDVFLLDERGVTELAGPTGELLLAPTIKRDRGGALLTVFDGAAWRWSPASGWERLVAAADERPITRVAQGPGDSLLYATEAGWYRWEGGDHRPLLATKTAVDAAVDGEVTWLMGGWPLRVWRAEGDGEPELRYESTYSYAWNLAPWGARSGSARAWRRSGWTPTAR
jgi:hypothetical protein